MAIGRRLTYGGTVLAVHMALMLCLSLPGGTAGAAPAHPDRAGRPPNILFFIMDDVGVDQIRSFGYGGATPPRTPNMDAIAHAGIRFRNTWSMPECTPSRAMFFEGRYPLRTNILNVITSTVLANSQVSPFEITTPKLLKSKRHYDSALFGKFHLAGPDNNPFGNGGPHALGWDFFYGFIEGAPHPIDITAGGAADENTTYQCGFVNDASQGACYFADDRPCTDTLAGPMPGRTCMELGGLFVPQENCQSTPPSTLNFDALNAYYVSPLVINRRNGTVEEVAPADPRARGYRTTLEVNAARDWIQQRPAHTPWMATVSFSSAHAPYQPPPTALLPLASVDTNDFNCTNEAQIRILSNQMIEAMDAEIGRLLVELGLATRRPNGRLDYHPESTNTMIVIVGDNGSFSPTVKLPFDVNRAKGSVYQTGVWVPLIVAGPLVQSPDRDVTHMVNVADLFALFGEIASIDVRKAVPKSHALDAVSMLPYLTNPQQPSLRQTNFTQTGLSLTANGVQPQPCVVQSINPPVCVQVFPQKELCEFETGVWWGAGHNDPVTDGVQPEGLDSCCAVNQFRYAQGQSQYDVLPDTAQAVRNEHFKLVQKTTTEFDPASNSCNSTTTTEFYAINEAAPRPAIDKAANDLLTAPQLTPEQLANFNALSDELQAILDSEVPCPGDGNLDKKVDWQDVLNWTLFRAVSHGESSWYDFNLDGRTNASDLAIIRQYLGTKCLK